MKDVGHHRFGYRMYTFSREPGNVDILHANHMRTYSNPAFSDDSFACFISSQECNVLFVLECLQMRVRTWGWRTAWLLQSSQMVPGFLLFQNILLTSSMIWPWPLQLIVISNSFSLFIWTLGFIWTPTGHLASYAGIPPVVIFYSWVCVCFYFLAKWNWGFFKSGDRCFSRSSYTE